MIETRREGPAVWLTIARPEASNALSRGVVDGLRAQLKQLASDASVRAVVLTGAGDKVFCGGADLKERRGMTPAETRSFLDDLNALMNELEALPLPTIAAIAGGAFGGGLELALC
ncbi:MAG: enoyl-CoA hydratase/isomerase family protein, partial [Deltaproteobacteria bacterium]|nr:enoyl-CoA hydratase/isomerase family protein [Deltaproteobacteria bacterium]